MGPQKTIAEWTAENELRSAAAAAHARDHRQPLAQRPVLGSSPLRIDFTKFKERLVSENFVFPKSTQQKLEEALAEIAELKKKQEMMKEEIKRLISSTPNYMKRWIQPSNE
jgi:hypothetical protein